jgi:3-oxoacyl-[acyl-carrier protein] reductase
MITYDFKGQKAIVTGGTRGIGRGIAEALLKAGATVVATYSGNTEAAEAFKAGLPAGQAERLELVKFDVGDLAAVEAFFKDFDARHGEPQILVNNAGIRRDSVVGLMRIEDWNLVLQTNLTSVFAMSKHAVQLMMGRRYGRIINITSPSGKLGFEGQANYAASKAGMVAFTKSLAKEVARRKITVNCVSPGFIDTDFIGSLPEEQLAAYKQSVPARRFGTPAEVASAVLFLASEEAAYITGTTLEVTGGI